MLFFLICLLIFQLIIWVGFSKQADLLETRKEKKQYINTPAESTWKLFHRLRQRCMPYSLTNAEIGEDLTSCFLVVYSKIYFFAFFIM